MHFLFCQQNFKYIYIEIKLIKNIPITHTYIFKKEKEKRSEINYVKTAKKNISGEV